MVDHAFQYNAGQGPAPERVGRFRVVERIPAGVGAQAVVYLGHDPATGADVAIKVLGSAFESYARSIVAALVGEQDMAELRREADLLQALWHPNIVAVVEAGEDQRHGPYIVTEWARGGSIRGRMDRAPGLRLPTGEAVGIARDALAGLGAAHDLEIIHRDIKPENILLDADGRAMLADFGIAGYAGSRPAHAGRGTAGYMAPEQEDPDGATDVGATADVYSLGVVLFEMLAGRLPVPGDDIRALRPEVPEATARCVERSILRDPSRRHRSAEAMAQTLAAAE